MFRFQQGSGRMRYQLIPWPPKMIGERDGGARAEGSGAANFLHGIRTNRGRHPRVAGGAGPRGKLSSPSGGDSFAGGEGAGGPIPLRERQEPVRRGARPASRIAGQVSPASSGRPWNFPTGSMANLLSPKGNASSGLCFNLSHSAGLAVYAIAKERNLGIDVEHVQPESAGDDIAQHYFSARELSDLRTLPPEARVAGFFHCWTRKEAYLKATGMGLQIPLHSFSVSVLPAMPPQFLGGVEARWHMDAFHPAEGYVAAVVYDGAPGSIKYFSVDAHLK